MLVPLLLSTALAAVQAEPASPFGLDLPDQPVPDRVSLTRRIPAGQKETWAELEGPGCIRHLWVTLTRPGRIEMPNRKVLIRIFFDDAETPHVEAPVGDFFGMMHGRDFYEINTELLSVKPWSGYNCYFEMPFAKKARIEFEAGPEEDHTVYLQVDWHRYPDQELREKRRFCAQWRREMPTRRYGEDFFMLDADGPGQLVGFIYGVRLIDNVDRWSHGGAENLYIDGLGDYPAYIRGIGGEDTFGTAYGGALHPPSSHLYASMPYYTHEDTGEARPAQRLTGYRFFIRDPILFRESLHLRFGSMENDISALVYWYQAGVPRRNTKMPKWDQLLPGKELKRGKMDLPLPDHGSWQVRGVFDNAEGRALRAAAEGREIDGEEGGDAKWIERRSLRGFVDFNHVYRPGKRGVGNHYRGKAAQARCVLHSDRDQDVRLRFAWDDHLVVRVNDDAPVDLGSQAAFRPREVQVRLKPGANTVLVTLSNEQGGNHGGWTFALKAADEQGGVLKPQPAAP